MPDPSLLEFPPFRFEPHTQKLWRGLESVPLNPKATRMLAHFLENPRKLLSKAELEQAVWGETTISADTLRSVVREVRAALDDDPHTPRFIETMHGRGYRFVAPVGVVGTEVGKDTTGAETTMARRATDTRHTRPATLVGRDDEWQQLSRAFETASDGERRVLFLSGEAGIGKTALVESFLADVSARGGVVTTRGCCLGGHGERDAYLALREALGHLCRRPDAQSTIDRLERQAPTWLVELPGVLDPEARRRVESTVIRAGRDRMLGELAVALEEIATDVPLVMLIEDVHWSDTATLDAIDLIARRREAARLLLLVTHRPTHADVDAGNPSVARLAQIRAELVAHDLAQDVALRRLSVEDTAAYLENRFPGAGANEALTAFLHARSEGNALMLTGHADAILRDGFLIESGGAWHVEGEFTELAIPTGVRRMIEYQLDRLDDAGRRAVEAASVAGVELDPSTLEGLEATLPDIERELARIAHEGALVVADAQRFRFVHALYQEVAYERVPPLTRTRLHLSIAEALERSGTAGSETNAASLATHFELGGDLPRAIHHLDRTAAQSIDRGAHPEATKLIRHALELLDSLRSSDPTSEVAHLDFALHAKLGDCLTIHAGYSDEAVVAAYGRAAELSTDLDADTPGLMTVLAGLCGFYAATGDHAAAERVSTRQRELAAETGDSHDFVISNLSHAITTFSIGRAAESIGCIEQCVATYDAARHNPHVRFAVTDPGVQGMAHGSMILGAAGRLDEALEWRQRSRELAAEIAHVPSAIQADFHAMILDQLVEDVDAAAATAKACLDAGLAHGIPYYVPGALVVSGWAQARRGDAVAGADGARQGIALIRAAGALLGVPLWSAMVAEAELLAGRFDLGLEVVADGLQVVEGTGERASAPALFWMEGELRLARGETDAGIAALDRGLASAEACTAPVQGLGPAVRLVETADTPARRDALRGLLERISGGADLPVIERAHRAAAR